MLREHNGDMENIVFDWKVIKKFQKPLSRQLKEALCIEKKDKSVNLNLKSEYFKNNTCKLILNKAEYTCDKCSRIFDNAKNLQVHDNDMHRRVPCKSEDCKYIAFGEKDFRYHEKSEHNNIN